MIVIGIGYVLAFPLQMGFTGIALGIAVSALTRAVPTALIFHRGKWKKTTDTYKQRQHY